MTHKAKAKAGTRKAKSKAGTRKAKAKAGTVRSKAKAKAKAAKNCPEASPRPRPWQALTSLQNDENILLVQEHYLVHFI
jgi:ElaB/YqjD/DUF883 family membrane-anchored ribosome-binding protein